MNNYQKIKKHIKQCNNCNGCGLVKSKYIECINCHGKKCYLCYEFGYIQHNYKESVKNVVVLVLF